MDSRQRRWRFASVEFDEASLKLIVDGRSVAIEAKPMAVLGVLLRRAGDVVTKAELLDAVWPNVMVVEASLPTAVGKLRRALGDEDRDGRIIETIPGIGYRLAVPVEVESATLPPDRRIALASPKMLHAVVAKGPVEHGVANVSRRWHLAAWGTALAATFGAGSFMAAKLTHPVPDVPAVAQPAFSQNDAAIALRKLDVERIEQLVRRGWDPNTPFDDQGNGALIMALQNCEWDVGHDRDRMVLTARTLIDAGAKLDHRNVWGDTAYSIAKAPRYCGPDHPVTKMLRAICYNGYKPLGDRCLATYE